MNSLQAKYQAKGLTIVGVTDEGRNETEAWTRKHGVRHPYAYDPTGWLGDYFNVRSIPFAVLIDPHGIIAWSGHPARLDDRTLQKALEGAVAQPITGWPKSTMKLQLLLKQGDYQAALSTAISLGKTYESFVRERIQAKVGAVQRAHAEGNFLAAARLGEVTVKELTGLREALTVKSLVDRMRRDPKIQKVIRGQEEVGKVVRDLGNARSPQEADRLVTQLEGLRHEYRGTIVSAQADAWLKQIERH